MITIKVRNFISYKGRRDVTHNSWFRCSNRLLEDPDFYDFLSDELLAWIYILSLCSQKNSDTVTINFDHAEKVCRIRKKHFESALEKLKGKQIDPVDVTSTLRERYADVTQTCATRQDITDKTEQTYAQVFDLERVYLAYPRKEGKAKGILKAKSEIKTQADYDSLYQAVIRYKEHCLKNATEPRYIKHFSSFMQTWRDWCDPETGSALSTVIPFRIEDHVEVRKNAK